MNTVSNHIRDHLLAGVLTDAVGDKAESLDSLIASEWSDDFEAHMRYRLLVGRYRYGRMDRTSDTNYDRIGSIIKRLRNYQITGNMEHLVDAANLCLMEFMHSAHPNKHFNSVDDGEHTSRTRE